MRIFRIFIVPLYSEIGISWQEIPDFTKIWPSKILKINNFQNPPLISPFTARPPDPREEKPYPPQTSPSSPPPTFPPDNQRKQKIHCRKMHTLTSNHPSHTSANRSNPSQPSVKSSDQGSLPTLSAAPAPGPSASSTKPSPSSPPSKAPVPSPPPQPSARNY